MKEPIRSICLLLLFATFGSPSTGRSAGVPSAKAGHTGEAASCFEVRLVKKSGEVSPLASYEVSVSGRVTSSSDGEALPGVNVVVKGTSTGTVTNVEGYYSISVPEDNDTLIFSSVGYLSEEVAVNGRSVVDVSLPEDIQSLSEVVVVGYGAQKRADITGSVASLSSESIKDLPVASVDQKLAGQLAGVQVAQSNAAPGAGVSVRIRGTGSLSAGNEPLYVIDGFPVENTYSHNFNPLSTINPGDIASIEVLKDASATAIYGSRGSNGVVIITTKNGTRGTAKIEFDAYTGVQQVLRKIDMMNAREYAELHVESRNTAYVARGGSPDDPNEDRPANFQLAPDLLDYTSIGEGTDWQDAIFRDAAIHNYQLTASGGSQQTRYLISGSYFKQDGIVNNTGFDRFTARVNVDSYLSQKLRVGINLTPSFTRGFGLNTEGHTHQDGAVNLALNMFPNLPVVNPDGTYSNGQNTLYGVNLENPVLLLNEFYERRKQVRLLATTFAEYEFFDGLTYKLNVGTDLSNASTHSFRPNTIGRGSQLRGQAITEGDLSDARRYNWLVENTLTYNTLINNDHSINALVGYTTQKQYNESSEMYALNFPNNFIRTLGAGQITSGDHAITEWSLLSYLARINYGYKDKYLLTATVRRDGSSRFGPDTKWGNFPSFSVGWRVSEENFMKALSPVSELKLRASYGLTGNNQIPTYGHLGLLVPDNYLRGPGLHEIVPGLAPGTLANLSLSWEKNRQLDIGLELALFNNRVSFTGDYYTKNTYDLLLDIPIPDVSGFQSALQNVGELKNTGWEFALNTQNFVKAFRWNTNFNISFNRNVVQNLGGLNEIEGRILGNLTHKTVVGYPLGSYFGYIMEGIFQNEEELAQYPVVPGNRGSQPGDIRYRDVSGDGVITPDDRAIMGNSLPDFTYGLTNTLSYKNFDLNVLVQGVSGMKVMNYLLRNMGHLQGSRNARKDLTDRWRSPDQPGKWFRANSNPTGFNTELSSRFIEDGSYLSVRNISLGYTFSKDVLGDFFMNSARVYVNVQNAFFFSDYMGYNPEASLQGDNHNPLTPGVDYGGYPLSRVYTVGFNLVL